MAFYWNALLKTLTKPLGGMEIGILIAGGIWLVLGIVNLFREDLLACGIFMILDAVFFTPVFLLAVDVILTDGFLWSIVGIVLFLNMLNWLVSCKVSIGGFLTGFIATLMVSGFLLGGVIGGFFGELLKKMLPQDALPVAVQFLTILVLFLPELVAFVVARVKAGDSGWSYSGAGCSHHDDPVYWATGDEQSVDTVSMWDGD